MPVGIVCQVNSEEETPAVTTGLFKYGTYADVLSVFERPDGAHSALVRARGKFRIMGRGSNPGAWLTARVKPVADNNDKSEELALVCEQIKSVALEAFTINDPTNLTPAIRQIDDNATLVNFLCTNLPFDPKAKTSCLPNRRFSTVPWGFSVWRRGRRGRRASFQGRGKPYARKSARTFPP